MVRKIIFYMVLMTGCISIGACDGKNADMEGDLQTAEHTVIPVSDEALCGHYICEEPGFGGMFELDLYEDGSAGYMEGASSSYFGDGFWTLSENRLMIKDVGYGEEWDIFFDVEDDCLIYDLEASQPFLYVDIPDCTKFLKRENIDEAWLADLNERIQERGREVFASIPKAVEDMKKRREEILSRVNKQPFQGLDFQGFVCFDASMNHADPSAPILIWVENADGEKLWESSLELSGEEDKAYHFYEKEGNINYIIEYSAYTKMHFYMFSLDATGAKIDELTYDVPENIDKAGFNMVVKPYFISSRLIVGVGGNGVAVWQ